MIFSIRAYPWSMEFTLQIEHNRKPYRVTVAQITSSETAPMFSVTGGTKNIIIQKHITGKSHKWQLFAGQVNKTFLDKLTREIDKRLAETST